LNFIDVATGSLGQGIGFACGMAYAGKYFDKSDYRVYTVLGDGSFDIFIFISETLKILLFR
jgi:transketolase